jgi:UDP-2,4-diacetamido-2,4,6-trideoxy-beta-L-altropyranose hydrolase
MIGLRADGSHLIGVGHISRALGLAEAMQRQGVETMWLTTSPLDSWRDQFERAGSSVVDLGTRNVEGSMVKALKDHQIETVVFDGYSFPQKLLTTVSKFTDQLVVIDDRVESANPDATLTVNPTSISSSVARDPSFVEGPRFLPLRRKGTRTISADLMADQGGPIRVLISFGGTDPMGGARKTLESLQHVNVPLEVVVATGNAPEIAVDALRELGANTNHGISIIGLQESLHEWYEWAQIAVCAAGTTMWELDASRVPVLACCVADNQQKGIQQFENHVNHLVVRNFGDLSTEELAKLIDELIVRYNRCVDVPALCDFHGADRLVGLICDLPYLRPAVASDVNFLYELAHQPSVRTASFQTGPFSFTSHQKWFEQITCAPDERLFVACLVTSDVDQLIGQFRGTLGTEGITVSVSTCESVRGKGLGTRLIELGSREVSLEFPGVPLVAHIRNTNTKSQRAFARAGYRLVGPEKSTSHVEMMFP